MRWPWRREIFLWSPVLHCSQRDSSLKGHDAIWLISVKLGLERQLKAATHKFNSDADWEEPPPPLLSSSLTPASSLHTVSRRVTGTLLMSAGFGLWPLTSSLEVTFYWRRPRMVSHTYIVAPIRIKTLVRYSFWQVNFFFFLANTVADRYLKASYLRFYQILAINHKSLYL